MAGRRRGQGGGGEEAHGGYHDPPGRALQPLGITTQAAPAVLRSARVSHPSHPRPLWDQVSRTTAGVSCHCGIKVFVIPYICNGGSPFSLLSARTALYVLHYTLV